MRVNLVKAAEIAATQNGRITTRQLRDCSFGNSSIENGVQSGLLHRLHAGVYAFGHLAQSRVGNWHAAVLACGPPAWLSVRCAATAYRIRDGVGPSIDVTIPSGGRRRPGIAIHRCRLETFEVTTWNRIPITSPNRTMVDLAHELRDEEAIEWAMRELQFRRLFDRHLLELSNHRRPNKTINRLLREMAPTRSPLEVALLHRVVRRHHLPAPEVNELVLGFLCDFVWPDARLIVETDGSQHDTPERRKAGAHRDNILQLAGWRVLRFRYDDVYRHHRRTAAQIRRGIDEFHPRRG